MMRTLGIILAAGRSSRLYPATLVNTKQLLPVYDKPLIYYPLSTLMQAGIRDYVVVTNSEEQAKFRALLGDSERSLGVEFSFLAQPRPLGIADAFNVLSRSMSQDLLRYDRVALILGDNIFHGGTLAIELSWAQSSEKSAMIFVKAVRDPQRFGVLGLDQLGQATSIVEKPLAPTSNLAVTGLYFYPMDVFERARALKPSHSRGELEITDINQQYLQEKNLLYRVLCDNTVWFDTGTPESLLDAATYVCGTQNRLYQLIGSPHVTAYKQGWINDAALMETANLCGKTQYGQHLKELLEKYT